MATSKERQDLRKKVMGEDFLTSTKEMEQVEDVEEVVEEAAPIFNFRKNNKIIPDKKQTIEDKPMTWKWGDKAGTKAPVDLTEDVPEPVETKAQKLEPGKYNVL